METTEHKLPAALYSDFMKQATKTSSELVKTCLDKTNDYAESLIVELNKKLDFIEQNKPVMKIQIADDAPIEMGEDVIPYMDRMIVNAKLGLNSLLVGPAGCGKTYAAEQLAKILKREFGHLNLTAGASETWLFGRQTPTGFVEGAFSRLYGAGGVFLADEMDAADPNLMLSINTAIANDCFYNPISGKTIKRNPEFVFVGAANTHGKGATSTYNGRSRLDGATLDRFIVIEVDYNQNVETKLCPILELRNILWEVRAKLRKDQAEEIISSRCFRYSYLQLKGGVSFDKIVDSITASWPQDLKKYFSNYRTKKFRV